MISYAGYQIRIEKKAQKYIQKLTESEYEKIVSKIKDLTSSNPESLNIKKLKGYKNLYRLRVDDYRIIFIVVSDKKTIIIPIIGHRKEVYDIAKRISL